MDNWREAGKVSSCNQSDRHLSSSWTVLSSVRDSEELGEVDTNLIKESRGRRRVKFKSHRKVV